MDLNNEYHSEDSAFEIQFENEEDLFDDDDSKVQMLGHTVNSDELDILIREKSDEDEQSDSIKSISSGDEDEPSMSKKPKQPIFTLLKNMTEMKWQPGLIFKSKEQFKDALTTYAVHMGVGLKIMKNDKRRVRVKCKPGCDWEIYVAPMKGQDTWEVRTIKDKHSCSREFNNKLLSAKWLSKRIESKVRDNPNISTKQIVDKAKEKWVVGISKDKAIRAKDKATSSIEGSVGEQYNYLKLYCTELLDSNRGSSVFLKFNWPPEFYNEFQPSRTIIPHFERVYVCLAGCRASFKCCRPIVGLDGCFLKGYYGGQLLTAIGRDPNDQMLPIAYAIVEVENKDSWSWFLYNLTRDIGSHGITYISDQQKGLVQTFKDLLPGVDHRFCVRHLYNNFRKKFPSKNLKCLLWKASNATYEAEWGRVMNEIKGISDKAYDHLYAVDKSLWCKHAFSKHPTCDVIVNNMSEAFNRVILDMRDKPILTMLEDIRVYLMGRWTNIRNRVEKQVSEVNPKIAKRLEEEAKFSGIWMPLWSQDKVFEVVRVPEKFIVSLDTNYCSCGKWRVSGLPCRHAISCMHYLNIDKFAYVPECFKKSTYMSCYAHSILPSNGPNHWPTMPTIEILPPVHRRAPGRPKKKRNVDASEQQSTTRMSRRCGTITCSKCGVIGHNKTTCKQT